MKSDLKYLVLLLCQTLIEGSFRRDYKYSVVTEGWFKHFVVPLTWFDARLRCALEGKDFIYPEVTVFDQTGPERSAVLASPTTPEMKAEMTNIFNSIETQHQYEVFTGIHATFSKGAYHTVQGIPLSEILKTWAPNEPDNKDNKESCLTLNSNGDLADLSCEATRPFICYRSQSNEVKVNECGTVDPEYHLDKSTKKCYKFHIVPRNFSRAFLTCAAEGGHLAIINSDTEAKALSDLFSKYPESSMLATSWKEAALIGFHDWNEHGDWRTIHGQTLTEAGYNKFALGEPNNAAPGQSCGAIFRSGLLDDMWCDRTAAFICERNPGYPLPYRGVPENAQYNE